MKNINYQGLATYHNAAQLTKPNIVCTGLHDIKVVADIEHVFSV